MRAAIEPLGARKDANLRSEAKAQLEQVKAALIGYLVLNGRLPCPGRDTVRDDAPCAVIEGGINASLLGLPGEVNDAGLLLDAWGTVLRYRLASKQPLGIQTSNADTSGFPQTAPQITDQDAGSLRICRTAFQGSCSRLNTRVDQLEFIVMTHGQDPGPAGAQSANLDGDATFAKLPESAVVGREFDDQLVWMSRSEMVYWLLRSGRKLF